MTHLLRCCSPTFFGLPSNEKEVSVRATSNHRLSIVNKIITLVLFATNIHTSIAQCPFDGLGYDEVAPLKYDRSLVRKGNKWGFVDSKNALIIPIKYDLAYSFNDSCALVGSYDRTRSDTSSYYDSQLDKDVTEISYKINYEVIDIFGKVILKLGDYEKVHPFCNGFALVGKEIRQPTLQNQLVMTFGLINKKGQFKLPMQYTNAGAVSEGAFTFLAGDKMGIIDINGDTIVPPIYENIKPFSCGWAMVLCSNGRFNYINHEGKKLLTEDAWDASEFRENRAFARLDYLSKWSSLIDTSGLVIKLIGFQKHGNFSEGLCAVWSRPDYLSNNEKTATFMNLNGEIVDIGAFDEVTDFCNGFAKVRDNKKVFYIDKNGKKASCD